MCRGQCCRPRRASHDRPRRIARPRHARWVATAREPVREQGTLPPCHWRPRSVRSAIQHYAQSRLAAAQCARFTACSDPRDTGKRGWRRAILARSARATATTGRRAGAGTRTLRRLAYSNSQHARAPRSSGRRNHASLGTLRVRRSDVATCAAGGYRRECARGSAAARADRPCARCRRRLSDSQDVSRFARADRGLLSRVEVAACGEKAPRSGRARGQFVVSTLPGIARQAHVLGREPRRQLLEQLTVRAHAPSLTERDVAGCDAILIVHQDGTAAVAARAKWRQQLGKSPRVCLAIHFDPQARREALAYTRKVEQLLRRDPHPPGKIVALRLAIHHQHGVLLQLVTVLLE